VRSTSLRLTLLWAPIATSATGAPTARAGDDSDLGEPVADATPAATTTTAGPAPQAVLDAHGDQSGKNSATSGASNGISGSEVANQTQSTGLGPAGQFPALGQNANIDQDADSGPIPQQQALPAIPDDGGSGGDASGGAVYVDGVSGGGVSGGSAEGRSGRISSAGAGR
jgi:hypothetical protein